jgi:OmpA-OmpF porin, OOP family
VHKFMKYFFKKITLSLPIALCALLTTGSVLAQTTPSAQATGSPGQVVVTGTVPDDASKFAILSKLREVYGADKIVDQISVGAVVMPPNWNTYVQKLISPNLKLINRGQLKIDGNVVSVRGEVSNEAQKQQIASDIASNLNPSYVVNNAYYNLGPRFTRPNLG